MSGFFSGVVRFRCSWMGIWICGVESIISL